jgi:hypothetical protein
MKTYLTTLVGLVLLLGAGATAQAQQYQQPPQGVTPWYSMYRGGSSPLGNYLTQTQPQLNNQAMFQQLRNQTQLNQQGIADLAAYGPNAYATGHQAGFMTHRGYFQTYGGGGPGGGVGGQGVGVGGAGAPVGGMGGGAGVGAPATGVGGGFNPGFGTVGR